MVTYKLIVLAIAIVACVYLTAKIIEIYDVPTFEIYWNAPTFQCRSHKIYFETLISKYRIKQNPGNDFKGEKITILYDPGNFPAILNDENGKNVLRNGGIPQEGNLTDHLLHFEERVNEDIPSETFSGLAVIDFESWRPIYRQNWGTLQAYKTLSEQRERELHPWWSKKRVSEAASFNFENAGRAFVEVTLRLAKSLRPNATWGYYAYPYCFNMLANNMYTECGDNVQKENDRLNWMFELSDSLHPSLYLPGTRLNGEQRVQMIEGRLTESMRINAQFGFKKEIFPYLWYLYQDSGEFLTREDLRNAFATLRSYRINGVVLWGSSNDVNTKSKCRRLYDYVDTVLGPTIVGA